MKTSILIFFCLIVSVLSKGQQATIRFDIKNNLTKDVYILNNDYSNAEIMFGERGFDLNLTDGKASHTFKLSKPIFIFVYFQGDSTKESSRYSFFLSPGDNLDFSVDALKPETTYQVKGKGGENNQPSIQRLNNDQFKLEGHKTDTLPGNVVKALKVKNADNRKLLDKYIVTYRPTKDFIKTHNLIVNYFPVIQYVNFKGNHKYAIRKAYTRNEDQWQAVEDSLTTATPLSNDEALIIPMNVYSLPIYITRVKERLWKHPEALPFYFGNEDGVATLKKDPENLPREKIINKHFTGKTREFLYAVLLKDAMNETEDNVSEIFTRFREAYPTSSYLPFLEPEIKKAEERKTRSMTTDMVIIESSDTFKSFDDILKLIKGKTVLLDMWGTWCGPCRSELATNSDAIKTHFKDKGLDYLYIANHDLGNESKWKELIPYYNMTGTHILASKELTKDIMAKIKGTGYPTYIIINKDGTFEVSEAGYPMKRDVLINQIERAIK